MLVEGIPTQNKTLTVVPTSPSLLLCSPLLSLLLVCSSQRIYSTLPFYFLTEILSGKIKS
jgi:hypothetical protein